MFSIKESLTPVALMATLLTIGLPTAASAQLLVIKSGGPSAATYPPGKKLTLDTKISLKAGDIVTVIDNKGTRTLRGPGTFSGGLAAGSQPAGRASLAALVATRNGRVARGGVVRGDNGQLSGGGRNPMLWSVNIAGGPSVCVPSTTNVSLWRADGKLPLAVKLTNTSTGVSAIARFSANQQSTTWPTATLPVVDGATYTISAATNKTVAIHQVKPNMDDMSSVAAGLIEHKCLEQIDILSDATSRTDPRPTAAR
jgi:hypothetical protein